MCVCVCVCTYMQTCLLSQLIYELPRFKAHLPVSLSKPKISRNITNLMLKNLNADCKVTTKTNQSKFVSSLNAY